MVYLDFGHIKSALGDSVHQNFEKISNGVDGFNETFKSPSEKCYPVGKIKELDRLDKALYEVIQHYKSLLKNDVDWARLKIIVTTTKAGVTDFQKENISDLVAKGMAGTGIDEPPMIISNACVSGVMGVIHGANLIEQSDISNVLVVGIDFATDFVLEGFESLHALSEDKCQPFDKNRKGINLSDCISAVFLTSNKDLVTSRAFQYLGGASGNDANHISGPSRTGEGLFQSVNRAINQSGLKVSDIDYINAHGTATNYNDQMESIAFERLELSHVPLNSLKGYYGHTLGAAGVLEIVLSMEQSLAGLVIGNNNLEEVGVTGKVNLPMENKSVDIKNLLKTSSGFGGINSSVILQKCN